MGQSAAPSTPPFVPAALAASNVGTWDYDVFSDRIRYDPTMAELFALPEEEGEEGVPASRIAAALHPDDRARFVAKRAHLVEHGGLFVVEYRTVDQQGRVRWILTRGRYEADDKGRIVRGRGICVDLTDSNEDDFASGGAFILVEPENGGLSDPLARAADHALAARQAIDDLRGSGRTGLRLCADALLFELGRQLAASIPNRRSSAS